MYCLYLTHSNWSVSEVWKIKITNASQVTVAMATHHAVKSMAGRQVKTGNLHGNPNTGDHQRQPKQAKWLTTNLVADDNLLLGNHSHGLSHHLWLVIVPWSVVCDIGERIQRASQKRNRIIFILVFLYLFILYLFICKIFLPSTLQFHLNILKLLSSLLLYLNLLTAPSLSLFDLPSSLPLSSLTCLSQ